MLCEILVVATPISCGNETRATSKNSWAGRRRDNRSSSCARIERLGPVRSLRSLRSDLISYMCVRRGKEDVYQTEVVAYPESCC